MVVENDISGGRERESAHFIGRKTYDGTNEPRARSINYRWTDGIFTFSLSLSLMPSEYILCIYISHRMCLTAVVSYPHLNQCVSNADLFFAPSPHPRHQTCYTHLMIFLFQMPFSCEMVILSPSISRSRERQLGVENPTSQFFSLLGSPFFLLAGMKTKNGNEYKEKDIYIYTSTTALMKPNVEG